MTMSSERLGIFGPTSALLAVSRRSLDAGCIHHFTGQAIPIGHTRLA